ncbi:FAD-binding oxidoreductase [Balneolaceae bacterium YR4-1]|uniref:FAD-binding oxidoreductase n=1 Tax=Halalkalibaculum roseum TaxID=2709311 RepID=A0A6M1SWS8_9BACT|nr:FAD-dependent oxidoreductase [Halalkalibaculum roseum]NGP76638.1 FAD-binding oxidoreductase [Halalkalibaculum roseum]
MNSSFDYCILGAGLAGLSLADSLQEHDLEVCVIEKDDIGSGASGTPGGLVNPATGRRATKSWKAEACYEAIAENLEMVSHYSKTPFYRNNGVLRPALTKKMAGKMRERFRETTWSEGWCHWLPEVEIKEKHPGITCIEGGLWLPVGITVDVGRYLQAYGSYLQEKGVHIITGFEPKPNNSSTGWEIRHNGHHVDAENLVYATGYGTLSVEYWKNIDFHPIKGQVATFQSNSDPLGFDHSLSSLGYIANLGGAEDNTFIQGSTYEHDFEDTAPSTYGKDYLRKRLRRILPGLEEHSEIIDQWSGVRLSTPNRKPVLGRHPEIQNLHLFAGLGSKGLLYGKFLAEHYVDHLLNGTDLFDEISIHRMLEKN